MKPLPEESEESKDWKRGRKRFYFQRKHDVHLYYFVLESYKWDEVKDDYHYDWRGNFVMKGGWKAIADQMNVCFGTKLTELQVRTRMKLLEEKDEEFSTLFEETMDLRDQIEAARLRLLSVLQARV